MYTTVLPYIVYAHTYLDMTKYKKYLNIPIFINKIKVSFIYMINIVPGKMAFEVVDYDIWACYICNGSR